MAIQLSRETERRIEELMARGGFATADEAVRYVLDENEGINLATLTTEEMEARYPGFREKIAEGLADLDAGRWIDGEEFFEQLEREERAADDRKTA